MPRWVIVALLVGGTLGALPGLGLTVFLLYVGDYAVVLVPFGIAMSVIGGLVGALLRWNSVDYIRRH